MAQDQHGGDAALQVVLRQEGLQHADFGHAGSRGLCAALPLQALDVGQLVKREHMVLHMHREVGPIAQVTSTPHHGQVDASAAALHPHGQDVDVFFLCGVHRLLVQHVRQGADLVADLGGLLVLHALGVRHHPSLQVVEHGLLLAQEEALGLAHVAAVVLFADQAHAGATAALDLIEQTRPGAVVVDGVFAGAKHEHLLQQQDAALDRPGVRVRPVVAVLLFDPASVISQAWKLV